MIWSKAYVREAENGALRVGATDISLDSVVIAFQEGQSAETIREQYPGLSLEEVYGAIAFYLANEEATHEYLKRQENVWKELRQKIEQLPSPVVERLRVMRKASIT